MKVTPELLERYYRGLCSPEERHAVELWQESIEADPELALPAGEDKQALKDRIWTPLALEIDIAKESQSQDIEPRIGIRSIPKTTLWFAAVCVCIVFAGAWFFSLERMPVTSSAVMITYKTIRAAKGQKLKLTLSDGTIINLNSGSEIRYPESFTDSSRKVYLNGEGYFTVAKDPSKPFYVYTDHTITRVLGTVFNLKAYPGSDVLLTVEEGKVRFGGIGRDHQSLVFIANQLGSYSMKGVLTHLNQIPVTDYTAWTKNKLVFSGQKLNQIIPVLERWYNVSINVEKDNLNEETFTGEFDNPSLHFLLDRMSFVMQFKYTINNNSIHIH